MSYNMAFEGVFVGKTNWCPDNTEEKKFCMTDAVRFMYLWCQGII